jgi:hypothetical protein
MERTKTDVDAILDVLEKAQARIEELQATVLQQQAMINAVLLCLRDRTQSDPKELEKLFAYYQEVVHEELLEINQDLEPFRAMAFNFEENPS